MSPPARDVTSVELCEITGATYRQVDHWVRTGRLQTTGGLGGSGNWRYHPGGEVAVVALVLRLLDAGFVLGAAFEVARAMTDHGLRNVRLRGDGDLALIDMAGSAS